MKAVFQLLASARNVFFIVARVPFIIIDEDRKPLKHSLDAYRDYYSGAGTREFHYEIYLVVESS